MPNDTMLAIVKEKPTSGVTITDLAIPEPQNEEILVKVKSASICGTDIGIYNWTPWAKGHITPPIVIGHEVVGEIIEVNTKLPTNLKKGDLVSSETHIFCNTCYQCQINNRHICEKMELFGIGRNGSFAEYATIPIRTTWKNDIAIPLNTMSAQEPLGNAVHVASKAQVAGKTVCIFGLGPTGLCAVAVAKAYGAKKVIGINRREYRRVLALKLGADEVYESLPEKYKNAYDVVLEMSGNSEALENALEGIRIAGILVFFGIPKTPASIDIGKYIINKEITTLSVFGRKIWETWHQVNDLLVQKKIDLTPLVTHTFKLSEFEKAMSVMMSGECGKILLIP